MKRVNIYGLICFALLAAVSLVSCSKDDTGADDGNKEINFVCKDFGTKSAVNATIEDLQANGFKVFAHTTFEPTATTPSTASSFERDVVYNLSATPQWSYTPKMYWIPNATFDFRGYYPGDFSAMDIQENGYGDYELHYDNVVDKTKQKDVLFASANKSHAQAKADGYQAVPLNFGHILSKINIKVKVDTHEQSGKTIPALGAIVKGIGLGGVAKSAMFTNGAWQEFYGVTEIGHNCNLIVGESEVDAGGDYNLITQDGEKLFEEEDGLLVVPQPLAAGEATLKMYVDIITPPVWNDTESEYEYEVLMQDQPLICAIPAITWEKNKKYLYTVTITQSFEIKFSEPEIEDWEDSEMTGTIIIK